MTTPILKITEASNGQVDQYLTYNEALRALESSTNNFYVVDMSAGNVTLTDAANVDPALNYIFSRNQVFRTSGNTVARVLTVPQSKRLFVVQNGGTFAVTVKRGTTEISINAGISTIFYCDGTANGLSAVSAGSGGVGGVASIATIADFASLETVPGRLFALQSISGSLGDNGGIFESVAGSAASDGINRTPTATPGVYVQRLTNFVETVKSVPNITALKALTNIFDGQVFLVREYNSGSGLGGGNFVFDAGGSGDDKGYIIPRTAGGVFRRITGSRTIEDYGYTGGALTTNQIIAAIGSGNIDTLNLDLDVSDAFVNPIVVPEFVNFSGFKINGQSLWDASAREGVYANIPADFPVSPIFRAYISGGKVVTDFDPSIYDASVNGSGDITYYVDPVSGSNSNDGLTEATPVRDIPNVFLKENASGLSPRSVVILGKPGDYNRNACWGETVNLPNYDVTLKPWGEGRISMWYGTNGTSFSAGASGTYTATHSVLSTVVDKAHKNQYGDYLVLKKVSTQAACEAEEGTYYWNSGTNALVVHLLAGRAPDTDLWLMLSAGQFGSTTASYSIYCENVDFFGGADSCYFRAQTAAYDIDVCLVNCRARYGSGNGFNTFGARQFISVDCEASYTTSDGFNYHSETELPRTRETLAIEINCRAFENGSPNTSPDSNDNASTGHDNCRILRYGTVGYATHGPVITDVNDCQSYNFYVRAGKSRATADNGDFVFSSVSSVGDGCKAWLDYCESMGGSDFSVMLGSTAEAWHRGSRFYPRISGARRLAKLDDVDFST